jgi:hypothetical protein
MPLEATNFVIYNTNMAAGQSSMTGVTLAPFTIKPLNLLDLSEVLTAVKMLTAVFLVVIPCNLVKWLPTFNPEEGGDTFLQNIGNVLQDYTVSQTKLFFDNRLLNNKQLLLKQLSYRL